MLEQFLEYLGDALQWMGQQLDGVPEDTLAISVYIIGTLLALWAWYGITSRLPRPIGGILWVIVFAALVTPSISEGDNAGLAPAIIAALFGLLTKDTTLILTNLSLMTFVAMIGFFMGFLWTRYKRIVHLQD